MVITSLYNPGRDETTDKNKKYLLLSMYEKFTVHLLNVYIYLYVLYGSDVTVIYGTMQATAHMLDIY